MHDAKSLPVGYELYVKEHPSSIINNWRNISEYKEMMAKKNGAHTIGLIGNDREFIKKHVDVQITVSSKSTARIQEVHRAIYQIVCEIVEKEFKIK